MLAADPNLLSDSDGSAIEHKVRGSGWRERRRTDGEVLVSILLKLANVAHRGRDETDFCTTKKKWGALQEKVSGRPHQATARKEKEALFFCRLLCESGSLFPVASLKRGQNLCWTRAENPQTP